MPSPSKSHLLASLLVGLSLSCLTGCVGPRACGSSCGPISLACNGCGECEGCGELYVDPWVNEPANCCDPCDQCGNYGGQSCGRCRTMFNGIASLWGYRCGDCGCGDTSCGGCDAGGCDSGGCGCGESSCDGGCDASCGCESGCDSCCDSPGTMMNEGEVIYQSGETHLSRAPTPAEVIEVMPAEMPYKPSRTRKIFRTRPSLAEGPPRASDY